MRASALIAAISLIAGCYRPLPRRPHAMETEHERHVRASRTRDLGLAALGAGLAISAIGIALAAHGSELQARESTADSEDGLLPLAAGMLAVSGGLALAIGGGVAIGVSYRSP